MVEVKMVISKQWFIDSFQGNIKDEYSFLDRIGNGAFGVVYLAENRKSGNLTVFNVKNIGLRYAVKTI
jgi:serine/threonine protein kinase